MHAEGRHRRGCFRAIDIVDEDHRIAFMRGAFATSGNTGAAAYAALRIDKHRLFHPLPPLHLAGRCAFALPAENRQLSRMNLLNSRRTGLELWNP